MTRSLRARESLEHLPPRPRVLATHLRLAPELAALCFLDDALRTVLVALVAEHASIDREPDGIETQTLRRARVLARRALALRDAIDDYRTAVFPSFDSPAPPDDDIPF